MPNASRLIAVTKNRSVKEIKTILAKGVTEIGENRVQEAQTKFPELPTGVTKHFIGRLQTNKVRDAVKLFEMIQSVDSLRLAQTIERECAKLGKTMPVLIQVNTSGEAQKGGCAPEEAPELVRAAKELPHLRIEGLMTVAVESEDKEKVRQCFRVLKALFDGIGGLKWLSMGMSGDYEIALEEGANMLRIGRKLFESL